MYLKVTVRDKHGDNFVRTIEVSSAADFGKVERAAAGWARDRLRGMPLFGNELRKELVMLMEWVDGAAPQQLKAQQSVTIKVPRKKRRK